MVLRQVIEVFVIFISALTCTYQNFTERTNCTTYLNAFAKTASEFTSCAVMYNKPVKMCENCVQTYIEFTDAYNNLFLIVDGHESCINKYVNRDRIQILTTVYGNVYDLWNAGNCNECFQLINGSVVNQVTNETATFNDLYMVMWQCISNVQNISFICEECNEEYRQLKKFYNNIGSGNDSTACMDVVDSMNSTKLLWGKVCSTNIRGPGIGVWLTVSGVFALTVLFYVIMRFATVFQPPAQRFRERVKSMLVG